MSLANRLVRCWYGPGRWCLLLLPLAVVFRMLAALRRHLYAHRWLPVERLPVPVIVIGNITAGGTGKTPLALWLVTRLTAAGYRPGIVSRGHGGRAQSPLPAFADSEAAAVGDEPVLLARRAVCPVWVGRRRAAAARALLQAHPEVDVIVADDGLQHYALARDMEVAVMDGERGLGNGWPLPAGPLRESRKRLSEVDAVVINGDGAGAAGLNCPFFRMRLIGRGFQALADPGRLAAVDRFRGRRVNALAGIGNPNRFFTALRNLGLDITAHAYPDHYAFRQSDLPAGTLLMTEKDAVKCARLHHPDAWAWVVDAEVDEGLETLVFKRLKHHGQQTA